MADRMMKATTATTRAPRSTNPIRTPYPLNMSRFLLRFRRAGFDAGPSRIVANRPWASVEALREIPQGKGEDSRVM
jgi:hypothetical protein